MSSTSTDTEYAFYLEIYHNGITAEGAFTIPAALGVDDTFIFGLLEALNGAAWPTGVTHPFTVSKYSSQSTSYTTDLTTDPPSFT